MAGSPWQQVGNEEWKEVGADLNGRGPTISKKVRNEKFNSRRRWKVKRMKNPIKVGSGSVIPIGG